MLDDRADVPLGAGERYLPRQERLLAEETASCDSQGESDKDCHTDTVGVSINNNGIVPNSETRCSIIDLKHASKMVLGPWAFALGSQGSVAHAGLFKIQGPTWKNYLQHVHHCDVHLPLQGIDEDLLPI